MRALNADDRAVVRSQLTGIWEEGEYDIVATPDGTMDFETDFGCNTDSVNCLFDTETIAKEEHSALQHTRV